MAVAAVSKVIAPVATPRPASAPVAPKPAASVISPAAAALAAAPTTLDVGTANFATLKLLKPVTVNGTAAQIEANLDNLQKLAAAGKITAVKVTDSGRQNITFTAAQYKKDAQIFAKLAGTAALTVKFSGDASNYRITPNANNTWTVADTRKNGDGTSTLKGANFLQFNDLTTFADTGSASINALLSGSSNQWWASSSKPAAATSDQLVTKGVYSLAPSSVKTQLTYSFLANANDGSATDKNGFAPMSTTQQQSVRDAFDYLSKLINVTFVEDNSNAGKTDISFGTNNQSAMRSAGYANPPNASGSHGVYLMLDNSAGNTNGNQARGTYGWQTLIHELGHTLGLKHPGNYNAGGGGAAGPYLPANLDNRRNTVMSYYNPGDAAMVNTRALGGGATEFSTSTVNPGTYQQLDIQALQFLYGANTGTTAADMAKYQTTAFADDFKGFQTLWAPKGATLDASAQTKANIIDMRAGAFSSVGILPSTTVSQLPKAVQKYQTYFGMNNVALATGSRLDSVKGGSGQDVIYASGSATIDGGAGDDTVYLAGVQADWTSNGQGSWTHTRDSSITVSLANVEKVKFYNAATQALTHTALDLRA